MSKGKTETVIAAYDITDEAEPLIYVAKTCAEMERVLGEKVVKKKSVSKLIASNSSGSRSGIKFMRVEI